MHTEKIMTHDMFYTGIPARHIPIETTRNGGAALSVVNLATNYSTTGVRKGKAVGR